MSVAVMYFADDLAIRAGNEGGVEDEAEPSEPDASAE